jgi:class 3 adenylate cyclase
LRKVSVRTKTIGVVIAAFLVTILAIMVISTNNQRNNLQTQNEKTLSTITAMLNLTIRNLMLNGEAPIAMNTLSDLRKIQDLEEAEIYRIDGSRAFHDYSTLERVNKNLKRAVFVKTERLPNRAVDNEHFRAVLETNSPKRVELVSPRAMEYYSPILSLPECRTCHGTVHLVRGVSYFRISTQMVHERVVESNAILAGIFVAAGLVIGIVLVVFLKRMIVSPLLEIGGSVRRVAGGDLTARVNVVRGDELGELGNEINAMIKGLEERYHLSKQVTKTAGERVRSRGVGTEESERRRLTVLFSDIRGFSFYAEKNPPQQVVDTLNMILQAQAQAVERWGGDVGAFMGDAVMATFPSEHKAVQCAYHMVRSVVALDRRHGTGLRVGIGVGTGEVIRGNIGSENRLGYAAVGDTVSIAARLSRLAKADMVLLSESSVEALTGRVQAKLVPGQTIKGKSGTVNFFVMERVFDESSRRWVG